MKKPAFAFSLIALAAIFLNSSMAGADSARPQSPVSSLPRMGEAGALDLAAESQTAYQKTNLKQAATEIRQGIRLSDAFEHHALTTPVGIRMMRIGEESGRLGEMTTRAARFHDDEASRWLERFSRAAEPVLMIAIGLVVGTIVVLLYMPIFDLAGNL